MMIGVAAVAVANIDLSRTVGAGTITAQSGGVVRRD